MIQKIRVITKIGPDLKGEGILADIYNMLEVRSINKVTSIKVYRLEGVSEKQAHFLAEKLFCEDINQSYTLNKPVVEAPAQVLEIGYKSGVMNPEVASIIKAAKDLGVELIACDTSFEYAFYGGLNKDRLLQVINRLRLFNPLTEHIVEQDPQTLIISAQPGQTVIVPIRNISDEDLMKLSADKLYLNLEEMKVIQKYFQKIKRDPTDIELETLAQTWSEHSGHKTFKATIKVDGKTKLPLIKRIQKEALKHKKNIVSAFVDNSGVMDFYDGYAICGKVETHNSPSAIEPYGGAMTGSGGVFRDILGTGLGAKSIASTDIFCFAPLDLPAEKLPEGSLSPQYLLKKVVHGVRDYGNRMGIPTNNGSVHFHEDFRAKPSVIVGAYGILPKKQAQIGKPKKGDLIISLGGRIGRDGIHGATFSSAEMTDQTISINSSAVQIGNAIEEKRMFDAILEARDANLLRAIQDCGGGGLSSAIGELGEKLGVKIDLKNAKLKYPGLAPWEMWVSESQERMILVMPKINLNKLKKICQKYEVEISVLGEFDGKKKLQVCFGKEVICNLDMEFLHHGLPKRVMVAKKPPVIPANAGIQLEKSGSKLDPRPLRGSSDLREDDKIREPKNEKEWIRILENVLAHGDICSKEPIVRLYDHSVGGTSDLQPYSGVEGNGPNDAAVVRPFLDKTYGMIIAHGLNPVLNKIDPYYGSLWAGVEALANYVAVGGDYRETSLINNYIWPFPDEESLYSLDQSVDAVCDLMSAFKLPVISGKDSLSSTYRGKNNLVIKIPPTLCMSVFGKIPDTSKTITADFKKEGSAIVLVGTLDIDSMGGSTYFDTKNVLGDKIPQVDIKLLPKIFTTIYSAIQKGAIFSCHDISEGGLITTIFEMCLGGGMGAVIDTSDGGRLKRSGRHDSSEVDRLDYFLFNETAGSFIVEVADEKMAEKLFKNIPYKILGQTKPEKSIEVKSGKQALFNAKLKDLVKEWQAPMRRLFP